MSGDSKEYMSSAFIGIGLAGMGLFIALASRARCPFPPGVARG